MKTAQLLTTMMVSGIAIANPFPNPALANPNQHSPTSTNVFINNPLNPTQPNHLTQPTNNRSTNNNAGNSSGGESFDFEEVLGELNPEQLLSQAQKELENQINQLLGSFSELLAINPGDYFEKILGDLNLENLDLSNIYGEMNVPNPNKLLEELQSIGTGDFSFGELLGSSVSDNLLLINEANVELTGKLAKSQAESSAFSDEAQEKIKEKIEFGDETAKTSAELSAATQQASERGKTLVQTGQNTDVTQELERLQLEAMGLQLDAEASQSGQLSILAAQQAAIFTETQQSRIDNAMRNQILSDISTALQGDKAGERVQHSANIRALSEGSQFSTFREMKE
ncbi:MAG: hypothetical protein VKK42_20105 [Lyngbya sp.]|nr:hypothetical protein [Lyngbya sp.]